MFTHLGKYFTKGKTMNENKIIVAGDALSTIKDVSLGLAILLSNCDMDSFP